MTSEAEHKEHKTKPKKLVLPVLVTTSVDIGRLQRELAEIDDALLQLGIREPGSKVKMPKTSRLLDQLIEQNEMNLLHEIDREHLKSMLETIRAKAPVLHLSFSADPSPNFLEKLMAWLRKEIDPYVLLTIGLQPNIGAGCILRTTNKYFDLSIRQDFISKRDLLLQQLTARSAHAEQPTGQPEEQGAGV